MKKHALTLVAVVALACLSTGSALAAPTSFGIRGGLTDDLDSLFFGGHVGIYPSGIPQLVLEPSLEFGLPFDDEFFDFFLRLNFHVKYMFPIGGGGQALYPLIGPSLMFISFDDGRFNDDGDDSETEVGVNLGGGFAIGRFAIELAFGLGDTNDLTLTALFNF